MYIFPSCGEKLGKVTRWPQTLRTHTQTLYLYSVQIMLNNIKNYRTNLSSRTTSKKKLYESKLFHVPNVISR